MHVVRDTHTNIAFTMYWALPSLAPIQTSENAVLDKSDGIKIKIKRDTARANAFERFLKQSFVWQVGKRVFVLLKSFWAFALDCEKTKTTRTICIV